MLARILFIIAASVCFVEVTSSAAADANTADELQTARRELIRRLDALHDLPQPRPGIGSKAFLPLLGETREWLGGAAEQEALMLELPQLTTRQLVTLWDVLWIAPDQAAGRTSTPRDMNALAPGFARRFNDAALAALAAEKEPDRRRLLINMLKPQAQTFTEPQATEFLKAGGWKE